MQFETTAQQTCYEKVSTWMHELFGEMVIVNEERPLFWLRSGSAYVRVNVYAWGTDDAAIMARAYVVYGAEITPELMRYLLQENTTRWFCAFGIDQDGDITFDHTIVGSTCEKLELRTTVLTVAQTADQYDDEIVRRFGGQTDLDQMRNK